MAHATSEPGTLYGRPLNANADVLRRASDACGRACGGKPSSPAYLANALSSDQLLSKECAHRHEAASPIDKRNAVYDLEVSVGGEALVSRSDGEPSLQLGSGV